MSEQKQIEEVLRFSKANSKLEKLYKVKELKPYLIGKRKIYSCDILSGWSCPAAHDCKSKVIIDAKTGGRKIQDGKHTQFRCFSASNESLYSNIYNLRKHNFDLIRTTLGYGIQKTKELILRSIPANAGIIRPNVAGDMMSLNYFKSWIEVIKARPDILFYAYTKQINLWIKLKDEIDKLPNFCLTGSFGGTHDDLLIKHGLRSVKVVYSEYEAKKLKLPIDNDDSHASRPSLRNQSYALLIHNQGPKGSRHAKRWAKIKKNKSFNGYSKKK